MTVFGQPAKATANQTGRLTVVIAVCLAIATELYPAGPSVAAGTDSTIASTDEGAASAALVDVRIDGDLLTLEVENVPLAEVLARICHQAGVKLSVQGNLDATVTKSLSGTPLDEAIAGLLGRTSYVMIYGRPPGSGDRPQLLEVRVSGEITGGVQTAARASDAFSEDQSEAAIWARRAVALGFSPEPGEDEELFSELAVSGEDDRLYAMRWLASQGDGEAISALGRFLALDPSSAVRSEAAQALAQIGSAAATHGLARGLGDSDPDVRFQIVEAIGKVKAPENTLVLGQVVFGEMDPQVRMSALESLGRMQSEAAWAFLEAAAEDPDPDVRKMAADILASWDLGEAQRN